MVFGGTKENTAGCTYYVVMIRSEEPLDYVYLNLQFPAKINNYKLGFPQEAHTAAAGPMAVEAWEAGKDAQGQCVIIQAAINNSADVQSSAVGHMLAIRASKLLAQTEIMGMIATTEGQSNIKPVPPSVHTEGAYEYLKLGQTVRRRLDVSDMGMADLK